MAPIDLQQAFAALDDCDASLVDLEAHCCDPGRSPQMAELGGTLTATRAALQRFAAVDDPSGLMSSLAEAGAGVRRLHVDCCDPARLPMYVEIIEGLDTVRLSVERATGTGD